MLSFTAVSPDSCKLVRVLTRASANADNFIKHINGRNGDNAFPFFRNAAKEKFHSPVTNANTG